MHPETPIKRPRTSNHTPRDAKRQRLLQELSEMPHEEPIWKSDSTRRFLDNSRPHPCTMLSSQYKGVYWDVASRNWHAQIMIKGVIQNLGCYEDEREAGIVYAKAAKKYKRAAPPPGIYAGLDLRNVPEQPLIPPKEGSKSPYKGVKLCKKRWQTRVTIPRRGPTTLGTFDTPEEAAQVYAKALYVLGVATGEPHESSPIGTDSAEEMINFRQEKESDNIETTCEASNMSTNTAIWEACGTMVSNVENEADDFNSDAEEIDKAEDIDDDDCVVLYDDEHPTGHRIEYFAAV